VLYEKYTYRVLVVSSSEKFTDALKPIVSEKNGYQATYANSISSAKRISLESSFDFVLINTPLKDEFGTKFAIDSSSNKTTISLMFVSSDLHEEIYSKVFKHGVFTLAKPTTASVIAESLRWMGTAKERLRKLDKKSSSLEKKMEDIRIVDRAKWLLIDKCHMTEPEAHHYIEKQAMDMCITKREIADEIISLYKEEQ